MTWQVLEHPDFTSELEDLPLEAKEKLGAAIRALQAMGPRLGRPTADTLEGSKHANMKELRFSAEGVWRIAFAFDPDRNAILLVAGNKEGLNQRRFYKWLIRTADERFDDWLESGE